MQQVEDEEAKQAVAESIRVARAREEEEDKKLADDFFSNLGAP